jgi:hypothetical protein
MIRIGCRAGVVLGVVFALALLPHRLALADMAIVKFTDGPVPLYDAEGSPLGSVASSDLSGYLPIAVDGRAAGGRLQFSIQGQVFLVDGVYVETDPPLEFTACPPGKVARAATNKTAGSRGSNAIECVD